MWHLLLLVSVTRANLLPGDPGGGHHHHHHDHDHDLGDHNHQHDHSPHHHDPEEHEERGGRSNDQLIDFAGAVDDPDTGLKCVFKNQTLDTLEQEKLLECTHSLINVCHYSYITSFKPNREEECEDHYEKICNIVFVPQASDEIIEHCYKPMVKNCNNVEPDAEDEICKDMHETECSTRYEKKGDKFVANTECKKIPLTLCGSRSCRFEEGEEECHNKTTASISTVPEESCDLVPQKTCKGVYKLVPFLQPTHQCKDVPREICTFGILSSKLGTAPLATKWCYNPEDGELLDQSLSNSAELPNLRPPTATLRPPTSAPTTIRPSGSARPPLDEPETDFLFPPPDIPFLPPLDSFLEPSPPTQDESFEDPLPNVEAIPPVSNFYLPPVSDLRQALGNKDRSERRIQQKKTEKLEARKVEENDAESQKLLEDLLESALDTVKKDPEGASRFGQKIVTESSSEADLGLEDILPDVFKFPNEAARDGKFRWKLPKGDNTPHISDDVEIFDHNRFPEEFQNIFGAIKQETKPNIKLAKVGPGVELEGHKPIAHVIKHGNQEDGVSRTVVIQNIPEAHKAFGIKNVPKQFFKHMEKVIKSGAIPFSAKPKIESALSKKQHEDKAFEKGTLRGEATFDLNETSEDREYLEDEFEDYKDEYDSNSSDYYEAEENLEIVPKFSIPTPRTIIIKNTAEDFARFGVTNLPKDLLPLLQEKTRDAKGVNVEIDPSGITKGENNGVFFNPHRTNDIQSTEAPGTETKPSFSSYTLSDKTVSPAESPDAGSVNLPSIFIQIETPLQFKSENNIAPPSEYSRSSAHDTIIDNTNQFQAKLSVKSTLESELEDNNGSDQSSSITRIGLENVPLEGTFGISSARLTLPLTSSSENLSPSELSSSTSSEYSSPPSSFPSAASSLSSSLPDPSSSKASDYSSPLAVPISSSVSNNNSPSSSSSSSFGSSDFSSVLEVSSTSSGIPISSDYSSSSGVLSTSDSVVSLSSSSDHSSPIGNTSASIFSSSSSSPLVFSSPSSSTTVSSSLPSSSEYGAPSDGSTPSPSSSDYSSPIGSPLSSSFHSSSSSSSTSSSDYSSPLGNPISSSSSSSSSSISSSDYSSPIENPNSFSSSSSSDYSSPLGTPLTSSSYSGSSGVSASSSSSLPVFSSFSSQPSSAPSISSQSSYSSPAFLSKPTPGSIVKSNPGSRAPSSSINYSARPNPPKQSNQNQDVSPQNIPQFILSTQPAGNLKSVPEILKPNKDQEYERPSSPQTSGGFKPPNIIYNQFKPTQDARKAQDNQYILTNRPMTFQTASGNFLPPSTLLYGFKPITEPGFINRPTNPPRSNFESAKYLGKPKSSINNSGYSSNLLQASNLQEKPRYKKSSSNSRDNSSSSVIDQISQFLESLFN